MLRSASSALTDSLGQGLLLPGARVSTGRAFCPQGALGSVWRQAWLSRWEGWCCQHLEGGSQGCRGAPYRAQEGPGQRPVQAQRLTAAPRQRAPRGNAPAQGSLRPRSARSAARPPRGVQTRSTRQAESKPFPLVLKARATRRTTDAGKETPMERAPPLESLTKEALTPQLARPPLPRPLVTLCSHSCDY